MSEISSKRQKVHSLLETRDVGLEIRDVGLEISDTGLEIRDVG